MDRSSRFQSPIPLSNGGFNRTPPIQNDGVGMKPLPPMILDRFRAMVKEREEELKVFGGAEVLPLSTDEVVRLYEIVLSELTMNSKPMITDLTIIAGEQRAHGEGIAGAICARIIEVPVDLKLPSLYLLDSIMKNIGKEYIKFFSALLPEIFCEAYAQAHPNMHPAMRHLFGTWSAVFPLSVLKMIEAQLQFSPSVNVQSGLTSSRASESPRPTHGIHINPKYLEAEQQFGHSTGDPFGTEGVSSTGRAGLATSGRDAANKPQLSTARTTSSSSPYGLGPTGPLSPSLEERVAVRTSPSRFGTDYGLSKVMGREEETSELKKRNWQGNSKPQSKASIPYKYSSTSGLDLRGPRALISAYGIDEREKHLNRKPLTAEEMDLNGAEQHVAIRTWQNTEEEEFDWDGMTPSLADHKQSNDIYPSLPPHANFSARHSFTTNQAARLPIHGSNNKISGMLPNFTGCSDLTSHIPPSFARESLIMPHQQPQSHFNAKRGGLLVESRRFLTAGEQKPPFISNLSNINGKVGGHPANFQNSHFLSSSTFSSQIPIRGQFAMNSAGNIAANQIHSDASSTRSMPLVTFPQISGMHHPGLVSLNMQRTAQPSLVLPNLLIAQEARSNISLPFSAPITSHTTVPHPNYGYRAQGRGGHNGPNPSNLVAGVQSLFPIPNIPNMPFHGASSIGQNTGQVAPSAPTGNGFSGLISSLMAQGLISLTKQDSVGVEFDPESLKVRHVGVINSLYTDLPRQCTTCGLRLKGQEEHSKHMDWHVSKNRTLKNRKTMPSPKWFVSIHMWLSGSEALGAEAVPGFLPAEKNVEEEDEELAVPADEDQNACALCGEPFDDFYSDETEEWMYRGAIYMYAPDGATVGMDRSQLGPIVHAKCMSNSNEVPSDDLRKSEMELTEEGNQRKRLRS